MALGASGQTEEVEGAKLVQGALSAGPASPGITALGGRGRP